MAPSRRTTRILLLALGIPLVFVVVAIVGLTYALGGFRENVAQDAVAPILKSIEVHGASRICDQGDAGYGLDNTEPWYQVSYEVPDAASAKNAFFAAAAEAGYPLAPNTMVNGHFAHQQFYTSDPSGSQLGLSLVIVRDSTVALNCASGSSLKEQTSGTGAIYEIGFTSPPREVG